MTELARTFTHSRHSVAHLTEHTMRPSRLSRRAQRRSGNRRQRLDGAAWAPEGPWACERESATRVCAWRHTSVCSYIPTCLNVQASAHSRRLAWHAPTLWTDTGLEAVHRFGRPAILRPGRTQLAMAAPSSREPDYRT